MSDDQDQAPSIDEWNLRGRQKAARKGRVGPTVGAVPKVDFDAEAAKRRMRDNFAAEKIKRIFDRG